MLYTWFGLSYFHIVGLTRICRFSPRIQQFSSRFQRELLNSLRESSNSRRDENCFSPLTTRIAQFSVTLERMRELLFSDEQRRLQFSSRRELLFSDQQRIGQISSRRELLFSDQQRIGQFSVATRFTFLFSLFVVIFWRISNSRRILRRELLNIRRELLDSLREFSNSRRNLDENCWIRGENPVKSRQPNCIRNG